MATLQQQQQPQQSPQLRPQQKAQPKQQQKQQLKQQPRRLLQQQRRENRCDTNFIQILGYIFFLFLNMALKIISFLR